MTATETPGHTFGVPNQRDVGWKSAHCYGSGKPLENGRCPHCGRDVDEFRFPEEKP